MSKVGAYFSFQGRANRRRYWLTSLAIYGLLVVAIIISFMIPAIGWILVGVEFLVAMTAGMAIAVRRLHDRDKSGWWLLPMYMPSLLLSVLGRVAETQSAESGVVFSALSLPFSIWILVDLGCLRGTVGSNRFGADPLEPSVAAVFG